MDELGFNKIAAAVLVTALGYMGIKMISSAAMHVETPAAPAYALALPEVGNVAEVEIEAPFPSLEFIAAMDATRGEKVFKKCQSCHNADDGGANGTGPNLWNIVGMASGQKAGFKYSSALAGSGLQWNYEELDGFLKKPGKYLSGTNMNFIGLKKENDRAAVIEYLRINSASPMAQPEAAPLPGAEAVVETVVETLDGTVAPEGTVMEGNIEMPAVIVPPTDLPTAGEVVEEVKTEIETEIKKEIAPEE